MLLSPLLLEMHYVSYDVVVSDADVDHHKTNVLLSFLLSSLFALVPFTLHVSHTYLHPCAALTFSLTSIHLNETWQQSSLFSSFSLRAVYAPL